MIVRTVFAFVLMATLAQCQSKKDAINEKLNPDFPYAINQPDQSFDVPTSLTELSALSMAEDGNLLTVHDEYGKIYKIDKNSGNIIGEYVFKPDGGDFEGVEMVGKTVYASSSKGSIYIIEQYSDAATQKVEKMSNELLRDADVEGLGYDAKANRLLLTCKAARGDEWSRELWAFDVASKKYSDAAIGSITLKQMQDWLKAHQAEEDSFKDILKSDLSEFHFGASAFAINPKDGNYYFLSSPGKILLVTQANGQIVNILKLDKKIHAQPEGMTFDNEGTLYISNEGKKEIGAKLYVFKPKK
jgi:uncharacterized protein YjiK